ncbi:MAG: hypothetical protein JWQ28_136 [Pedobacter sp.]|nr:hypothetical protein [Pedobacter sp.]
MFDQILNLVKEHIGGNPEVSSAIPAERQDEVHHEIANHIQDGLKSQTSGQGGAGGLLSSLTGGGGGISSAITGGLTGSLASKFGLPASATAAITAAIPGLLQKFAHKANDPNDSSITPESLGSSLTGNAGGGLSGLFK